MIARAENAANRRPQRIEISIRPSGRLRWSANPNRTDFSREKGDLLLPEVFMGVVCGVFGRDVHLFLTNYRCSPSSKLLRLGALLVCDMWVTEIV